MLVCMGLEHWDAKRKKYVLYANSVQHSLDCQRFPFNRIPRRVFLDTNVINCLVKWRAQVFEHERIPADTKDILARDLEALMHVFSVGGRADWDLVGSPKTLDELARTRDAELRDDLLDYGIQIADRYVESEESGATLDLAQRLAALPDVADRDLIAHAISLKCDAFCTSDRRTILSKRNRLGELTLRILSPAEWWSHVKPWAGLWG